MIEIVLKNHLCTGCGTCEAYCPSEAIKMVGNNKLGLFIPQLDKKKCINCGFCLEICPGKGIDIGTLSNNLKQEGIIEDSLIGRYFNIYIGNTTDSILRYNSTSGGIATSLLLEALEKRAIDGALVIIELKNKKFYNYKSIIAKTKDEIISATGSKYCPVPVNSELKSVLKNGAKYAVVGLPCQIDAIRKLEAFDKEFKKCIVLHIGLICNHTPTLHATKYILKKVNVNEKNIVRIKYRGKGWPGGMTIQLDNGSEKFIPHFSPIYWGAAFQLFFWPFRCLLCNNKMNVRSDITLGDAWQIDQFDNLGKSLIITRTKSGHDLIQILENQGKIKLSGINPKQVIKSQDLINANKQFIARSKLYKIFGHSGPNLSQTDSLKPTFKEYIKALIFYICNFPSKRPPDYLVDIFLFIWRPTKRLINIKSKV